MQAARSFVPSSGCVPVWLRMPEDGLCVSSVPSTFTANDVLPAGTELGRRNTPLLITAASD
ncbi:hypothetical protein JCM9957A_22030 [Kineosporia succinea]